LLGRGDGFAESSLNLMDGISWLFIVFLFLFVGWFLFCLLVGLWRFFWNGSVMWLLANVPAF
jgi:hypothetical protein